MSVGKKENYVWTHHVEPVPMCLCWISTTVWHKKVKSCNIDNETRPYQFWSFATVSTTCSFISSRKHLEQILVKIPTMSFIYHLFVWEAFRKSLSSSVFLPKLDIFSFPPKVAFLERKAAIKQIFLCSDQYLKPSSIALPFTWESEGNRPINSNILATIWKAIFLFCWNLFHVACKEVSNVCSIINLKRLLCYCKMNWVRSGKDGFEVFETPWPKWLPPQ